jgi:hypothetical protein
VSWSSKKQNSVALSTAEAEYVAAGAYCAQLLWMRLTLRDFGCKFSKVPLLCDNESAIKLANNPVRVEYRGKNRSVGLILVFPRQLRETVGGGYFFLCHDI